jgi:hypothetical protein
MTRALCSESDGRASGAIRFNRNIAQPFRNAQGWLLHQQFFFSTQQLCLGEQPDLRGASNSIDLEQSASSFWTWFNTRQNHAPTR